MGADVMMRRDHPPELHPDSVYAGLAAVGINDRIPPSIYVADYANGVIPDWRIHGREEAHGVVMLVAFDMSNVYAADSRPGQLSLFSDHHMCYPAVCILSSPAKTLRCHPVEFNGEWPNTLCDMIQQATHIGGKRRERSTL